jgi:MFS family permease
VRRLVVVISAIVFLDAMLFGALIPLVPGYVDAFDLTKLQAGLLVGAFGAGAILGGIPGGILAGRVGPKNAVVAGLVLLAVATFGLAFAGSPQTVGVARFLQGVSSALTWAGALSWVTVSTPRAVRGQLLGTVFGIAVLGAILGPMLGALAQIVGIRAGFAGIGVVALALATAALLQARAPVERVERGALRRAVADPAFVAGLWLNTLPALFFGVLDVLAPLALHAGGYGAVAIATVFLVAGLIETALNPLLGRLSDRRGRLLPIRWALSASIGVGILLAFAQAPLLIAGLAVAAAVSFGGFYTPGIALVSDRAEFAGLAQGLAFGLMNTTWAIGALVGPTIGGGLADAFGDAAPYLLCSLLCAVTLAAVVRRVRPQPPLVG